jgi:stage IV sporulation protein FB
MKKLIEEIKKAVSVPLKLNWTLLILLVLFIVSYKTIGIIYFTIAVLSLLVHEYTHTWMALRKGVSVYKVELNAFGGGAFMDSEAFMYNHKKGLKIALAGPLSSLALFLIALPLFFLLPNETTWFFMSVNAILALFNLFPLYPMDGGRVLYHGLAKKFGELKSIKAVVMTTYILGGVFILLSLFSSNWWMVAIFAFIIFLARHEKEIVIANYKNSFLK